MNTHQHLDDNAMIEEIKRRMASKKPGTAIPGDKVKVFIKRLGKEIEQNGGLAKEHVDELLRQLKNGEL
jgi:hypothetical protein